MKLYLILLAGMSLSFSAVAQTPENMEVAPMLGQDVAAEEGLEIEEGVQSPYVEGGVSEAQQLYVDKNAEEKEEIEQEDADSRQMEAEAEVNESLNPMEELTPVEPVSPVESVVEPQASAEE